MTHGVRTLTRDRQDILPLRMRADLVIDPARFGQRRYWNIKDPITLRYYQLREEEYFILRSLDGQTSVAELRNRFERTYAPLQLGPSQLQSYLSSLHSQGLVLSDRPGQGRLLLERRNARRRSGRWAWPTSILAIRFRGLDPEPWLRWLYPKCRWLFSRGAFAAGLLLVAGALTLVAVQHEALVARLPEFHAFFNLRNLVWIGAATAVAKVLHEVGHALTCKHFGGECHEMGVMLLVFAPCLYCNVSDAWLMKNKWHRVAVSAAGIWVEVVLASLCTFLWWFTEPGLLNTISLNIMFVCSVSTLLFNGNPLLRYDGYYVLADLVEVPNLRQRASLLLGGLLGWWCLGIPRAAERLLPARGRGWLLVYAVASTIYPILTVLGILWFLHRVLRPYGLGVVAQVISVLFVLSTAALWLRRGGGVLRQAMASGQVKTSRVLAGIAAFLTIILAICLVPLPHRVAAPAVIEARDAQRVFVTVTGRLPAEEMHGRIRVGDAVRRGDSLAVLENPAIEGQIIELERDTALLRARIDALATIRVRNERVGSQLPTTEEALQQLESQLKQRREQQNQLRLTAPVDGIVLPDEDQPRPPPYGELGTWTGSPLDPTNAGCTLEAGTVYCLVGDPQQLEALLIIDQSQIEFVCAGQPVHIWLRELPGQRLTGTVTKVADSQIETVPRALLAQGELAVTPDASGVMRPASAAFQVRVSLDSRNESVPLRSTGWAKIEVAPQSLGQRLYRYLVSTFRFL